MVLRVFAIRQTTKHAVTFGVCLLSFTLGVSFGSGTALAQTSSAQQGQAAMPAMDTSLASLHGLVYAVSDDHKHVLSRSAQGWTQCFSEIRFGDIRALTASDAALFVADAETRSIVSIDPASGGSEALYVGAPIVNPDDIAHSHGHLYIADLSSGILDLDVTTRHLSRLSLGTALHIIGHLYLSASRERLLISNPEEGILIRVSNISSEAATRTDYLCPPSSSSCLSPESKRPNGLPPITAASPTSIPSIRQPAAAAYERGVLYIIDNATKHVFASSEDKLRPVRLDVANKHVVTPTRLLVSESSIIIFDASTRDIVVWPLLVPTEFVADVQRAEPLSAMYNLLFSSGLLPTTTVPLDTSIEHTLRVHQVLLSPYSHLMDPVICGLNQHLCTKGAPLKDIPADTPLVIPDLYSESYIDLRTVSLHGTQTLHSKLKSLIRDASFDPWRSQEQLLKLNPQFHQSTIHQIRDQTKGTFTVPVELVRYLAGVPAGDLSDRTSSFMALQSKYEGALSLYSLEGAATTTQDDDLATMLVKLDKESFRSAFRQLQTTINYMHPIPRANTNPIIGVAEEFIDCDNPDIADSCMRLPDDSTTSQSVKVPSASGPAIFRAFKGADHGTAVAGIIAAKSTEYQEAGLDAPEGDVLFLYRNGDLGEEVKEAVLHGGVQVFNFSFKFDNPIAPAKLADEVSDKASNTKRLANALFVVAAPDEGKPVCVSADVWPICWANQANVIGVAATTLDGSDLVPSKGLGKWGSDYVQLAAPGIGYGATGINREYVAVSGTSFAAPIVSAAAALLSEQATLTPVQIKQRLIATATVMPKYEDRVQGGLLNVRRAVTHLNEAVLVSGTGPNSTADRHELYAKIAYGNAITFRRANGNDIQTDLTNVLRLTLESSGDYRVVFRDPINNDVLHVERGVTFPPNKPWRFQYRETNKPGDKLNPPREGDLSTLVDYIGPVM